eukprot:CAMPEP_0172947056 /NCGR_PEP_ID=MMETSP1075-20121228/227376_1 /TAXON_ID=2916 /ORGANISM="Ceratium fusus, Strain PA161109" /LENGTH=152 /DNA_ID=CAMNT_0013808523 /DNA_START=2151 /DNA_END=2606 /DNA_ORIENTATION=+
MARFCATFRGNNSTPRDDRLERTEGSSRCVKAPCKAFKSTSRVSWSVTASPSLFGEPRAPLKASASPLIAFSESFRPKGRCGLDTAELALPRAAAAAAALPSGGGFGLKAALPRGGGFGCGRLLPGGGALPRGMPCALTVAGGGVGGAAANG